MNREIKFRGKCGPNWIYGYYHKNEIGEYGIYDLLYKMVIYCDESSIGQYTGSTDKNGVEIYEGDIIKVLYLGATIYGEEPEPGVEIVKYEGIHGRYPFNQIGLEQCPMVSSESDDIEIISNIYENPNLLNNES